jgi:hypothetical protein
VPLLTGLGIARQQHARRAVGEEDGHRVVVGLVEELARRGDDVGSWSYLLQVLVGFPDPRLRSGRGEGVTPAGFEPYG